MFDKSGLEELKKKSFTKPTLDMEEEHAHVPDSFLLLAVLHIFQTGGNVAMFAWDRYEQPRDNKGVYSYLFAFCIVVHGLAKCI